MFQQAVTALAQSLEINPHSPLVHSNIGLAYYLFTQIEKAMEHWRMVSQLDRAYAASREEEQQRSFDESIIRLRPINWRDRVVKLAPVLPRPATRLLPARALANFVWP
jgi:tetratricopeptide (TPR) repeat protein